jgi:hypothetical protein
MTKASKTYLKPSSSVELTFLLAFVPLYEVLKISAALYFITGPSAMWLLPFPVIHFSIFLIYPGLLMFFWMLAKKFGLHLDRRTCLSSAGFYLGAWPLAMVLAPLTGVPSDAIHTIKSGNLFLFMTIGVGIPFLASRNHKSPSADAVRSKLVELGITEDDIADAVKWARERS